jgi:hypothetical protein
MRPREPFPAPIRRIRRLAQIFRDQFVLRGEVPVERHFIGAGRFGDRLHADRPDSVPVKELARGCKDARMGRNPAVFIESCGCLGGHFKAPS